MCFTTLPLEQSGIMIDYIEATKYQCKDSPNLGHCKVFPSRLNSYDWETYALQGCRRMEIHWNSGMRALRIKCSLPYFLQGHNFSFSNTDFIEGIDVLQNLLGIGLWDATVKAFEYGCIFPVERKPAEFIRNHTALPEAHLNLNERGKDKGAFRLWENSALSIKMYDAKKNILMKQGLKTREVITRAGYDPDQQYLKFELHIKKPHLLNNGRDLILEDLQNPEFIYNLSTTVVNQYHQLQPMRTLKLPTNKKDLSALNIALSVHVESLINQGVPPEEAQKRIYSFINKLSYLTKADRYSRKATIRKAFKKIQEAESSPWDLTQKISRALTDEVTQMAREPTLSSS